MPAPFVPNPNVVEVAIKQRLFNRPVTNVLYFFLPFVPVVEELHSFADQVRTEWVAHVAPKLTDQVLFTGVRARSLAVQDAPQWDEDLAQPIAGGLGLTTLPANCALVLTHRTSLPGRAYRGRTYIAGVPQAGSSGNYMNADWAANVLSGFYLFREGVNTAASSYHVVYSRRFNGAWRAEGAATTVISTTVRNLRIDSQRRRTGKDI